MIAQLLSFAFITFNSFVWGAIIKRITSWTTSFYLDFLVGFATCNAILTLVSIFYPINEQISILLLAISSGILVFNLGWMMQYSKSIYTTLILMLRQYYVWFSMAVIFIVVVFFKSLYSPSLHYDAGLYHIQSIKWISEYPTVKGLGNLNYTFGYNFNIFTWFAASSFQGFFKQPIYSVNFTLTFFFAFFIFCHLAIQVKFKRYFLAGAFLLILYSTIYHYYPHISTTTNNIAVFILITTVFISLTEVDKKNDLIFPIIILSVYSVTIKISALPVLLLAAYLFLNKLNLKNRRKYIDCLVICCLILLPWLYKNVILTGWVIYPINYIDLFSFEWKIPYENVVEIKRMIKIFTQGGESNWIMHWVKSQNIADILILSGALILSGIVLLKILTKKIYKSQTLLVGIITSLSGVLFMFFNAPNLWYGMSFVCCTILLAMNFINIESNICKYLFYGAGILIFSTFLKDNWFHPWHFTKHLSERYLLPYPIDKQPNSSFSYFLIDKKIKCYYPIFSDQCYDYNLPCTYKENQELHLIGGTIKEGFYYKSK